MADLLGFFADAGCGEPAAYIQSGNIVFEASPALAARVPALIQERIAVALGLRVPVVVRTHDELAAVVAKNPFIAEGIDPERLFVSFLAGSPTEAQIASLDPARSPPDRFVVFGKDVYLSLLHAAKTRFTADYFDRRLTTTSTARNWRTVTKLLELTGTRQNAHRP